MIYPSHKKRGFVAITAVLMLSVIFLSVSIGSALESIAGSEQEQAVHQSDRADHVVRACAEYVLMELTRTLEYATNDSILIEEETCDYSIEMNGDGGGHILLVSTVNAHTARLRITVGSLSPHTVIESWEFDPE